VNCSGTPKAAVLLWVGLDGWRSSTVEQGGTRADCLNGVAKYSAWYEFYPREPSTMNLTSLKVSPGNLVLASVKYLDEFFNITVTNLSTHEHATVLGAYSRAARLDAEWIVEAPGYQNGTRWALPSFGQVQFNDTYAVINGYSDSIGAAKNGTVVYYCMGNHFRLVPSTLGSGWTSFTLFSIDSVGC
jgi:Peptidase A4 family